MKLERFQTGAILIFVMFLVTALMVLILELASLASYESDSAKVFVNELQAMEAAKSGIFIAMLYLESDARAEAENEDEPPYDWLGDAWAKDYQFALGNATVALHIEDEHRRLNIFDLVNGNQSAQYRSTKNQFLDLLHATAERFEDRVPEELMSQLDAYVYRTRKTPLKTKDELMFIDGFSGHFFFGEGPSESEEDGLGEEVTLFPGLRAYIALYPSSNTVRINVNTAPEEVLMSISPHITRDRAQQIIQERGPGTDNGAPFTSIADLRERLEELMKTRLPPNGQFTLDSEISGRLTVKSDYFTITSKGAVETTSGRVTIVSVQALVLRAGATTRILSIQADPEKHFFRQEDVERTQSDFPEFYQKLYPEDQ